MTVYGYTKGSYGSSATMTATRSVDAGNTIFFFVQHSGSNSVTMTDNGTGNTWTQVGDTYNYSTPATGGRLGSVWKCTAATNITSITATGTAGLRLATHLRQIDADQLNGIHVLSFERDARGVRRQMGGGADPPAGVDD